MKQFLLTALLSLFSTVFIQSADQPNILWISAEDISPHLGCYGDPHAITPHLDQLASEGTRYTHAFTTAGVCAPCRSTIITGMYQNSIGTHHMRCNSKLPDWLKPFPMYLRDAGYYCTNNSKTDYQFSKPGKQEIWDECNSKAHWKNRKENQPFFAVYNFTGCHESGIESKSKYKSVSSVLTPDQRQDPTAFTNLPPYYPDTPVVREDWKRNYENITAMDLWAGNLIKELKAAGEYENTIIIYWSDHGIGLPRAKRWLYDSGTRVPLIVRFPEAYRSNGQGEPGSVSDELINSTDFGPSVLNLAGVEVPDYMHGRAFLGKNLTEPRKYVYGSRDRMDERYDIIRAVRDKKYRYIRNFEPLKPYYQYMNTPEKGATMREIRKAETEGTLTDAQKLFSADRKPVEELYDLEADPHEVHNLANDPAHETKLKELRRELADWQFRIGDIGLLPESEIERREKNSSSTYAILREKGDGAELIGKLVDIATKASQGPAALPDLENALAESDPAIRYWGATGIGNFSDDVTDSESISPKLHTLLTDRTAAVRIAAGRALCRMGDTEKALPSLAEELSGELQWARLEAAIALDYLGEVAKPALPQLKTALKNQPNKYIVRVANKAVNDLEGTQNKVP
ncbi:MAG: sulfatase-like hydrolase/transferase [Verrucomicrobiales bacterium]|nr:sulfatase-like hydrolase/transferase [Verrucomicrobiales bacterium]